jgi:hypothetical protein
MVKSDTIDLVKPQSRIAPVWRNLLFMKDGRSLFGAHIFSSESVTRRDWTQEEIDDEMARDAEDMTDEEMAEEECGRWINGRLGKLCTKAGSEECDWICPLSGVRP